ncbi:MAG TPA: iron dicitrate transport regulator FecR, partial [Isosphaeraceae bacterium]
MENDPGRDDIEAVLARFLEGEPEPGDGEALAAAMVGDPDFAREVARLLMLDDLLRQGAMPDERAFVESLKIRLGLGVDNGGFLRRFDGLSLSRKIGA